MSEEKSQDQDVPEANDIVSNPFASTPESISDVPKMTPDEIRAGTEALDPKAMATEVLDWLITNVENYIDNAEKTFRLMLTIAGDAMPESKRFQDLYLAVPDDEEVIGELLDALDEICNQVVEAMKADTERMEKLFKRLVFFYEMTGYCNVSGPLVQQMDGSVDITEFVFDPMPMTMQVKQPVMKVVDGQPVDTGEKRVVKTIEIPAGFGVEITLECWPKRPASLL